MNKNFIVVVLLLLCPLLSRPDIRKTATTSGPASEGQKGPEPPIFTALDADRDGTISARELARATISLKTLDKNGDGKLTRGEYIPPRPGEETRGEDPSGPGDLRAPSVEEPQPGDPGEADGANGPGDPRVQGDETPRPPKPPIDTSLDADADGVISAGEIADAPVRLLALDKNGDGMLTKDECLPRRQGRPSVSESGGMPPG